MKSNKDEYMLAICYDFDKTLTPDDMQAQGLIQKLGFDVEDFWRESNATAEKHNMDQNSAWMLKISETSKGKLLASRETFYSFGKEIRFFNGVEGWFERINNFGKENNVKIEHYIISSGLKEIIEGTSLAKKNVFKKIYASSFYYDENGIAKWPAQVVNYTNKTQFLFRISKGTLDINDQSVNDSFKEEELKIPFRNIVYIGDSDTDIPCMKLVNSRGGHSIGVYGDDEDKTKVYNMIRDNRVQYFSKADYSEGSELDKLVKGIIKKTSSYEYLQELGLKYKNEVKNFDRSHVRTEEERRKDLLIDKLEASDSFKYTHKIINELSNYNNWDSEQIERFSKILKRNNQVGYIIKDKDLNDFYRRLVENKDKENSKIAYILSKIN